MKLKNELCKEKIESKNIFKKLKSDYFLQLLFNNLLKKKSLDIIKYNNNIKSRMNISIKDYKEYSEIYSTIEIVLIINMVHLLILIKKKKYIFIYILIITKKR